MFRIRRFFADPTKFHTYTYDPKACDAYYEHNRQPDRIHFAIMLGDTPIGELILKRIDRQSGHCAMGICMKNDTYKNRGYGSTAEKLALEYAVQELELKTVFADALIHNTRSQHVLEKVGFQRTHQDELFVYYRYDVVPEGVGSFS